MMTSKPIITEHAAAKINLALHVTGQRDDGYHQLHSLVVFTALGDIVTCVASAADQLTIDGPLAENVPNDSSNSVLQARDYLRRSFPHHECSPVALHLTKNLPSAAGIGGGSADAAATLRALGKHWALPLETLDNNALAEILGADVPMCLAQKPLIASGIGGEIKILETPLPPLALVLVNCGDAVSTPAIFRALINKDNDGLPALPPIINDNTLVEYLKTTRNDLLSAAVTLSPDINQSLKALEAEAALYNQMSGSGATCFGVFASLAAAENAAETIRRQNPTWFCAATPLCV